MSRLPSFPLPALPAAWAPLLFLLCLRPVAAAPIVPDAPVMRLDEIGTYAVGYAYRGGSEQRLPEGWSGPFQEQSGLACQPAGTQNGRPAFLLHCPWRGGTGIAFQEFTFRLPAARRVRLRGATAMGRDSAGKSDGATFRVRADGRTLLERHRTDTAWEPFDLDLTATAGRVVTLRFETDPGPRDNPAFDFTLWAGRELVLEGFRPVMRKHPDPPELSLARVTAPARTVVPTDGYGGRTSARLDAGVARFRYEGPDGTLEYSWQRPSSERDGLFGRVLLRARMKGDTPVQLPLAASAALQWTSEAIPTGSRWESSLGAIRCVRSFRIGGERTEVRITGRWQGKSLVFAVECDRPVVRRLEAGGWGPVLRRRPVAIPYYSGQIWYLPVENLFTNSFLDWTASAASAHEGDRARYDARTDGSRVPLRERVVYTAAWHLEETLPNIPNPASPYRAELGRRTVLDIWGGRYTDIARQLERLSAAGIEGGVAIIHDWQRSGYDNALPAHLPANARLGGDAGMKTLVTTARRLGYRIALHENYVDYYPNYEGFSEGDVALEPGGKRMLAWFNPGTGIQSFAIQPNAILRVAAGQSPEIHRRFGTNGCYLDVHSAVPPWFHVDARAGETGAGRFSRVWEVHRALWDLERRTHEGPVFGEGNHHWFWSGLLDGVEAQFGSGWPANQGTTAPLAVEFDLLKIHPLQLNHGMGYYERWAEGNGSGAAPPMVRLDQYRMQEVAYGHAGFLGGGIWSLLPLAWLEHHLLTPVTSRAAVARPVEIRYEADGRWLSPSQAAKAGARERLRVRYDNGLTLVANGAGRPLRAGDRLLPQFGWLARGGGVTAYTALRAGQVVDYAETATSLFANARRSADWSALGIRRIRPEMAEFAQTGTRSFRAAYRWRVEERLQRDYRCFVHFLSPGKAAPEAIRFQQDHVLAAPTSQWRPGERRTDGPYEVRLPADLPDGDYRWTLGLFLPEGGRLALEGADNGSNGITLGILHVINGGSILSFTPEQSGGDVRTRLYREHLNDLRQPVDFGTVRTDGSVLVRREGAAWVLRALTTGGEPSVELNDRRFPMPARVSSTGGRSAFVRPVRRGHWWRLPLNGPRQYRWKSGRE